MTRKSGVSIIRFWGFYKEVALGDFVDLKCENLKRENF